jgi:hypothetical protein
VIALFLGQDHSVCRPPVLSKFEFTVIFILYYCVQVAGNGERQTVKSACKQGWLRSCVHGGWSLLALQSQSTLFVGHLLATSVDHCGIGASSRPVGLPAVCIRAQVHHTNSELKRRPFMHIRLAGEDGRCKEEDRSRTCMRESTGATWTRAFSCRQG